MQANASLSPSIAAIRETALGRETALDLDRLDREADSAYWLRFLNGRWLIYWHERLIGDLPAEHATLALAFLRQKQSERPAQE
ncbi:MAG TPA: hypothetical protein VGP48_03190 [Stellaceae bacterium]|jgi:hypothetical protein|nr:hypothetical protein [Stellaceae bacterium]